MAVQRIDVVEVPEWIGSKFEFTPEGFLKGRAPCTNIGVFTYIRGDGSFIRELRIPDEVFNPDSMGSLALKPLTLGHPNTPVTVDNIKELAVGSTGTQVINGEGVYLSVDIVVTDKQAIDEIKAGRQFLSCGYSCDVEPISGRYLGMEYDAIQRNIRYNHLAIVDTPRAGETAKIKLDHLDALDAVLIDTQEVKEDVMPENDTLDSLNQKITALEADKVGLLSKIDSLVAEKTVVEGERDTFKEKVDQLTAELQQKKDSIPSAADIAALVQGKIALLDRAKTIGADVKCDMSEIDIKKAVIVTVFPKALLEGKNDQYVEARYDLALEEFDSKKDAQQDADVRRLNGDSIPDGADNENIVEKARKAYLNRLRGDKAQK